MDAAVRTVVEAIHASPAQAVLYLSGGASQAVGWLLCVPRASNTVLEIKIPYSRMSMRQLLGKTPSQIVSRESAEDIALAAYNRALSLSLPGAPAAGIGLSGALASATPKRGDHRFTMSCNLSRLSFNPLQSSANVPYRSSNADGHLALWGHPVQGGLSRATLRWLSGVYPLPLKVAFVVQGMRDRNGEDEVTSRMLIKAVSDVCGLSSGLSFGLNEAEEKLCLSQVTFSEAEQLEQLLKGTTSMINYFGSADSEREGRRVLLSGAFNPMHDGHLKLLNVACSLCNGGFGCFELSAINADKPPLSQDEIKIRVNQFQNLGRMVIVTNRPFFYNKAEILPDSTFVVGIDTALRLINPKYYGGSREKMLDDLLRMQQLGCDFLVAGRKSDGKFQVLDDLSIPGELRNMFKAIPVQQFREDISSTEIRQKSGH